MAANVPVTEEAQEAIRAESNITGALNGPQGHVSAKTVNSVQFMGWGLLRLANILQSGIYPISYPESSGSLVSGLVARRDSGEMEFFPQKSGVPVVVRMLSFIKTEVNVSREVSMLDESLDGNQKS